MADALSATFAALADPTRRAILARLSEGEATVNDIAAPFDMSLQAVSRHLKVLEARGSSARAEPHNGGRADSTPLPCATRTSGWRRTENSSRRASTDSRSNSHEWSPTTPN